MSTLWTPDGERPVPRRSAAGPSSPLSDSPPAGQPAQGRSAAPPASGPGTEPDGRGPQPGEELSDADRARLAELQRQLADTPAEVIVTNHAFGLFELAALHLSLQPPQLPQARLAIDALGALVEGLSGRLGEAEPQLQEALGQLRLAFVQIHGAHQAGSAGS